uniref:Protein ABIL5 n=1 Tax=Fagus sylvatica TaxID=28930 RepID=A0A2N9IUW9_FAGSY
MHNSIKSCSSFQSLEDESEDITRFEKSIQELKELRSQLHYAADYSETTYMNAKEKKIAMENTKEYICRAVVTVVDHLGSASANLDCRISQTNAFSEAEFRINCLKQVSINVLDTDDQTNNKVVDKHELDREEDVPLFLYTCAQKPSLEKGTTKSASVLPVRDGLSGLSKGSNPTFHFQGTQMIGRHRKSVQGNDILSLIRRIKRTA